MSLSGTLAKILAKPEGSSDSEVNVKDDLYSSLDIVLRGQRELEFLKICKKTA